MNCVSEIADGELTGLLNPGNLDFSKLKAILHQMQKWQESEIDCEEIATLQKLQAMMGDEMESDFDELANEAIEKVLLENDTTNKSTEEPCCSECGTSWKSIHEDGLVGCPHCYVSFAAPLQKILGQLHNSTEHTGKTPRFRERQERLKENQEKREKHRVEMLQHRLDAAIQAENYEEAAQIRDKISQVSKVDS
ncbi:MAG: UvrB/UvrC motif-containing protein [Abditibacteriaceae bacterium]